MLGEPPAVEAACYGDDGSLLIHPSTEFAVHGGRRRAAAMAGTKSRRRQPRRASTSCCHGRHEELTAAAMVGVGELQPWPARRADGGGEQQQTSGDAGGDPTTMAPTQTDWPQTSVLFFKLSYVSFPMATIPRERVLSLPFPLKTVGHS